MIKQISFFVCACAFAVDLGTGAARAQSETVSSPYRQTIGSAEPKSKRFRLYLEDFLAANLSYDLNPNSPGLIVSPSIGVLYVFPQVGLNARTPGSRYFSFGATQNVFLTPPILQVSYGQQWRTSFFEIGLLGYAPTRAALHDYDGPRIVPRLALGTRF